nr:uncharacterized protein CTRU02_14687 [Colletotrichum truncatum]KAF6781903.1 hypothetical protein CTRU02_14687 [Colletotrichum truncatum]
MSFKSDDVDVGSNAAGQSHGHADMSSHDHSLAHRINNYPATPWLLEAFLQTNNRAERIAAGSPRSGVGILGLGLLEHHIRLLPTMRSAQDAFHVFDHSTAAASPKYLGWRQKVATWPLSQQEAMNNRTFAA